MTFKKSFQPQFFSSYNLFALTKLMKRLPIFSTTQKVFGEKRSNHSIYKPDKQKDEVVTIKNKNKNSLHQQIPKSIYDNSHRNLIQSFPKNREQIEMSIGIIRSSWYNHKMQLITYVYGTGFHVSQRIIMTCTHNIYSSFRNRFADKIQFLPRIKEGLVKYQYVNIRRSIDEGYFQNFFSEQKSEDFLSQSMKQMLNFQYKPKRQEITLIALTEVNISQKQFLRMPIGNLKESLMDTSTQLKIVGYPSEYYRTEMNFIDAFVKRVELNGYFHSIQYYTTEKNEKRLQIINHTMQTKQGFSGSPIIACHDGYYYAIGIHTHKGRSISYNSAVYFDQQFLDVVEQFNEKIMTKLKRTSKNADEFKQQQQKIAIIKFQLREDYRESQIKNKRQEKKENQQNDQQDDPQLIQEQPYQQDQNDIDSSISLFSCFSQQGNREDDDSKQKQLINDFGSEGSKMEDLYQGYLRKSKSDSCSESGSQMCDFELLEYFTIITDKANEESISFHCPYLPHHLNKESDFQNQSQNQFRSYKGINRLKFQQHAKRSIIDRVDNLIKQTVQTG